MDEIVENYLCLFQAYFIKKMPSETSGNTVRFSVPEIVIIDEGLVGGGSQAGAPALLGRQHLSKFMSITTYFIRSKILKIPLYNAITMQLPCIGQKNELNMRIYS